MSILYGIFFALRQLLTSEGFPPKPQFEEKDVPDLSGKVVFPLFHAREYMRPNLPIVYLITGGAGGIGFELVKILYSKNANVYIAGRSSDNAIAAVNKIREEYPKSDGGLAFLQLDLSDLTSIKPAVDKFLQKERRLDAVVHNAGIMITPTHWRTVQGWDIQFGTNVIGPFVLQRHLQNILVETAKIAPKNSVRTVFLSSISAPLAPPGGIDYKNLESKGVSAFSAIQYFDSGLKYAHSKCANTIMAMGFAQKFKDTGIIAVSANPGNLNTDLLRHSLIAWVFFRPWLYPARYGAITELYATLSPEINDTSNGALIIPWGRTGPIRQDILDSCQEGGAVKFWDWLDENTQGF
ncbi:hypothetical protein H072_7314 [Dactylellina haptotyla CBS 200.50]|uniref:NAD(P)-binding protein n=1 Tax=Dactylellina haptotyla (strain CBS 200.50) TaxID=1284197 RepID=S8BUD1_DACHA|nr:hypothetical protein H072_7314 [Dactylellina haptotyla CBS 200.50]